MIRGDCIHHGLPEKHKNTCRAAAEPFTDLPPRASVGGGCEMATTNRLPRKIGPRLVQGVSTATSDALTAVGSVDAVAQTGWSWFGG